MTKSGDALVKTFSLSEMEGARDRVLLEIFLNRLLGAAELAVFLYMGGKLNFPGPIDLALVKILMEFFRNETTEITDAERRLIAAELRVETLKRKTAISGSDVHVRAWYHLDEALTKITQ